ncbi:MAG: hypothetical protein IJ071_06370 [Ruminococcus sp.]|nr:hypothetical protein [Ruminococcus sp.]
MTYSSILYIFCFLPVSLLICAAVPERHRNKAIFLLSALFCASFGIGYLCFMLGYVLVNYTCGRLTEKERDRGRRGAIPFAVGVAADVLALLAARSPLFSGLREALPGAAFPVGISLFTLSAVGYLVDVFSGRLRPERHIIRFSLYLMMFPRLIMGPIVSYRRFKRISRSRELSLENIGQGMTLFVLGLAKKVLLADNLLMLYRAVGGVDSSKLSVATAWLGALSYVLCLYFTLSGFSDMGSGAALCLGYRFPPAFRHPMFSSSFSRFGGRWHIQVMDWSRRYVTRPLSMATDKIWLRRTVFVAVMGVTAYWYGFSTGSLIAGLLFGCLCLAEHYLIPKKLLKTTGMIYTFLGIMVCGAFLASGSATAGAGFLWAMVGGARAIADSLSFYLLRSYIVVLLIALYASSDLFRNMLSRAEKTKLRGMIYALKPAAVLMLLALCTAFIAHSGSSGEMLLTL